jgi:hypothetical protein
MDIYFKYLSPTEWDVERDDVDFHVRLENDDYFVDAFDSQTEDPDSAHLTTFRSDDWKAVEAFVRDFNPQTKLPESGYGDRCGHRIVQ